MNGQQVVFETLDKMGIQYEGMDHGPVLTIEQMEALPLPADVHVAKNLFLRDAKGKRHILVVMDKNRPADLHGLEKVIDSTRLSFASTERLAMRLSLIRGAVSPLGVLNDDARAVEVVFDPGLKKYARIGVHPNDNTATIFIRYDDLLRIVTEHGNAIHYLPEQI